MSLEGLGPKPDSPQQRKGKIKLASCLEFREYILDFYVIIFTLINVKTNITWEIVEKIGMILKVTIVGRYLKSCQSLLRGLTECLK
tara:strand:- start:344 stop:601 length:258 start_codon:yes stop_codon:yes gene_type:complete